MRWTRTVALACLAALALGACGSSSHQTAASTPAAPTTSAITSTTTTSTSSAPTTTTATTTTPVQANVCRAPGLQLSFLGGQAATGHGLLGFELKNTSATSCHTIGYPGVQFLDKAGAMLPTAPTHTTQDFFGTAPVRSLEVAAGQAVSFRLGVTHFAANGSNAGCMTAYGLQVIAPNDTATLRVSISQGVSECGTATVSPVQPGTSAYP